MLTNPYNNSERTNKAKPKFLRLQFMNKKRESDLKFWVDSEFVLHPCPTTSQEAQS